MHLVVCVKQVPDTTEVRINPATNTLMRKGVPSIMNPYDAHALEAAIRLKELYGGQVTVLSMGPLQADKTLKRAISFGADRAILLSDRKFAGSDTLATSYILGEALQKIGNEKPIDLIFCGKQAIDGDTGQVGPGIAARLGLTQLTYVSKIEEIDLVKKEITVQRKLEGELEVIRARLPVLLTVVKDINELSYSSLPNLFRAAKYQPEIWTKDDLPYDETKLGLKGSPTVVRRIFPPPQRKEGRVIEIGETNLTSAINELVDILVTTKITADK